MRSAECGVRSAEGQNNAVAVRAGSGSQPSALSPQPPRGVTLVELLITITIISILAGLILGVASVAGEKARENQTRHVVQRMHQLLMEHCDTYKTRRVRVRPQIVTGINNANPTNPSLRGINLAYARLYALRELMVMEIPDRWSDVLLNEVPPTPTGINDALLPYYQDVRGLSNNGRTGLSGVYLRRYGAIANRINSLTDVENSHDEIVDNESAECLYMVITLATGDGEARGLFAENSIGDVDGDGAPEFLDGWGNPIAFLRWAPGADSLIQIDANTLDKPPSLPQQITNNFTNFPAWMSAAAGDHDPYDAYRVDKPAFRLVPLIFSAGGDETYGIQNLTAYESPVEGYKVLEGLRPQNIDDEPEPTNWPAILPWASVADPEDTSTRWYLGMPDPDVEGATDNIHNHLLGLRGRP